MALSIVMPGPQRELSHHHRVVFYERDDALVDKIARFVLDGREADEPAIVIASPPHRHALVERLVAARVDPEVACRRGRLTLLDADDMLRVFLIDGRPDWTLFEHTIGSAIERASAIATGARVRVYSEMIDLLRRTDRGAAAASLEELWDRLAAKHPFELVCACAVDELDGSRAELTKLLAGIAHDLRNPLATIMTAAELLMMRARDSASETDQRVLQRIQDNAERMARMVEQLAELARIHGG